MERVRSPNAGPRWRSLSSSESGAQAFCWSTLGLVAAAGQRSAEAIDHLLTSLRLFRLEGEDREAASVLTNLGNVAQDVGDLYAGERFFSGALQLFERLGDLRGAAACLNNLSMLARIRGDLDHAVELSTRALDHFTEVGDLHGQAATGHNLAGLWASQGATDEAARIYERAAQWFTMIGDVTAAATARHNAAQLQRSVTELSARELQVTVLVAAGLSNREIADRLFVSQRTVESHTSHIFTKLGLISRTQLAMWASQRDLGPRDDVTGALTG